MANSPKNNDKYGRILDAAIRVFAKNGFYSSKVAEIAKEANVADGTIYLYFKNKDDILIKLFEDRMNVIIDRLKTRLRGVNDSFEKIAIFIRSHFEIAKEQPDLASVITIELRQSAKFMKEYDNKQFIEYLAILSGIIREGKDNGAFRENISPGIVKRSMFGMLDELALYHVLSKPDAKYSLERMSEELTEFVIRGLKP